MKAKNDELGRKLFFLSPSEKRNGILLGQLFRAGKAVKLLEGKSSIPSVSTKAKNEALALVLRSTSYFRPNCAEEVTQSLRHSSDLQRDGYPVLARMFQEKALEIAWRAELFELMLLPMVDAFENSDILQKAWQALQEIQELQSVFVHVKNHMREPDPKVKAAHLLPLLEGVLAKTPRSKRARKLLAASKFRILFFLQRYPEALKEATSLLGCFDDELDQAELLPVLGMAISLKLYLGEDITSDISNIWKLIPSSPRIAQLRCLELCQIEWFRFAVHGDVEAGSRAHRITKASLPLDLLAGHEKLVAASIFQGLSWALLSNMPMAFEDLQEITEPYLAHAESEFEWVLIATACHQFCHGEHDAIPQKLRQLKRIKTTWTASFLISMIESWGQAGLSASKRKLIITKAAEAANDQPEREQSYFDLADYFELLSSRAAVIPRRARAMGGDKIATQ